MRARLRAIARRVRVLASAVRVVLVGAVGRARLGRGLGRLLILAILAECAHRHLNRPARGTGEPRTYVHVHHFRVPAVVISVIERAAEHALDDVDVMFAPIDGGHAPFAARAMPSRRGTRQVSIDELARATGR